MKCLTAVVSLLALFGAGNAQAQVEIFPKPWATPALWSADTLWVGASFTRSSPAPVTVTLKGNGAGWSGDLFFIDPKTGVEDRLFSNHDPVGTTVTLSARHDIPIGDTLYFVYRVTQPVSGIYPSPASVLPKYTGPNIAGQSRYVAVPTNPKYGHRWSVAGRVNDSIVEFGFEDNVEAASSDYDFDDIVFRTTLSLLTDEVPAHLSFTDKAGTKLADGAFYSPANDTLYLVYTDDYASGNIRKDVVIRIKNRRGDAAPDSESVSVLPLLRDGTTGTWTAKLPIQEAGGVPGDGKAQVYYLGEATASVRSHNRSGLADGGTVTATLNIAYPDRPETVKVRPCSDSAAPIVRTTVCIEVRVADQSFTRNPDTVWAAVKCDLSGDVLARVALLEQPDGSYQSSGLAKNENPADPADGALSCKMTDNITVTYTDEVYGNKATAKAAWSGEAPEALYFAKNGDIATPITSLKDGTDGNAFLIAAKGPSPTVGAKDTLLIAVTTEQGESELLTATETEANSNVYSVPADFLFRTTPPAAGSGHIEAYLDPAKVVSSVTVSAKAVINGKPYAAQLILTPAMNTAQAAYIKDRDGDGRGDQVFVVFSRPLEGLPATVTPLYWNQLLDDPQHAFTGVPKSIAADPARPNALIIDLSDTPFPKGFTGVPDGAQPPVVTLPADNRFGGQKPIVADSMGPILTKAEIRPFNGLSIGKDTRTLDVDTLIVTVSEKLATRSDWQDLIRVGAASEGQCRDYGKTLPVIPLRPPEADAGGSTFTLLIGDGGLRPLAGDCVYLNVNGTYSDRLGNLPPIHGEVLTGKPPSRHIESIQGYPPVAGLDPNLSSFAVSNGDLHAREAFNSANGSAWIVGWIPPADWPADYVPGVSGYGPELHDPADPVRPGQDQGKAARMPSDIGAVQVVSTGEYVADVSIYDNLGNWVKDFSQAFGFRGELSNIERKAKNGRGLVSFLVWNLKDSRGGKAGNGAYVWKIRFRFKSGKQEVRYVRTGVTRSLPK